MKDHSIISFQQANIALGDEFNAMTKVNPEYKEKANQSSQVAMFFLKRTDVIVIDELIFKYYQLNLKKIPTDQKVVYHDLFDASHYRMAFREKEVRDAFNRGFKKIKKSGRYDEIIKSYLKKNNLD